MDRDFWLQRWQEGQIGFHQEQVNGYLTRHWSKLASENKNVLVTLCGKSKDMLWLAEQGCQVMGIEISAMAVEAFFDENSMSPQKRQAGKFEVYEYGPYALWCGDMFDLTPENIDGIDKVYDRASLIALPPQMRERYAQHLSRLLPAGGQVLLVTMEYPQEEMSGPPFSVHQNEVNELYQNTFDIKQLEECDILAQNPRFKERGLSALVEKTYLMTRK